MQVNWCNAIQLTKGRGSTLIAPILLYNIAPRFLRPEFGLDYAIPFDMLPVVINE